ncbi:suppressor of fused domain protein [Microbacterium sp. 22179]|uniref:suppressor of fused domain protein n=1 Tax=Microbacterium sp. 22179 TaxID=3453886 RepID=UPI003F8635FB
MTSDHGFPEHVFDSLGVAPAPFPDLIGGSVRIVEKRPTDGPVTVMTLGASRLPTDSGEQVELAVEVIDGQQGAAFAALEIVCDDIARNRRVPPVGAPWRNTEPFLSGTRITAIMATGSRWGSSFDEVRHEGALVGHVRTLRLLTDTEAAYAAARGWEALVAEAGSLDALLDVTRDDAVAAPAGIAGNRPVFLSKLHAEHPPRWVTFTGAHLQSVTGLESDAYMNDSANHEVWSVDSFLARFPWISDFARQALPGQTALFTDASGAYVLEND